MRARRRGSELGVAPARLVGVTSAGTPGNSGTPGTPKTDADRPAATISVKQYAGTGLWMAIRGALGVIFGLATVFWPREMLGGPTNLGIPVRTADLIIAVFLVLQAVLILVQVKYSPAIIRTPLLGQAIVVVPALVFLLLASTAGQLRAAVCVWAVLHAIIELWIYALLRATPNANDYLIAGGVHLLLGIALLVGFSMHALSVTGFSGAAVLIASILYIIGGFTRRSRVRTLRDSGLGDDDAAADTDILAAEELVAIQRRDEADGEEGFEPHGRA